MCLFLLFLMCWLSAVPEIAFVDWYLICVHCNWKQAREQASGAGVCENWDMVVSVIWKNGASRQVRVAVGWWEEMREPIVKNRDKKVEKKKKELGKCAPKIVNDTCEENLQL